MNKTTLENWEERFDGKLLLLAMDIAEKAHKEEVLDIDSSELKKIVKDLLSSSQKDKEKAVEDYKKSLFKTADEWDEETPVISPLDGKPIKGVKMPRATMFLEKLFAINESLKSKKE